jgi:hypothetical protein
MRWRSLTKLVSNPELDTRVEIRSPIPSRRLSVDRDALATMLLRGDSGMAARLTDLEIIGEWDDDPAGIPHWIDRGWGEALETYLASRDVSFIEDTVAPQDRDEVRAETVRKMLRERPLPQPQRAGPDAMPLPRADSAMRDEPLGTVLAQRRTTPYFSGEPITLNALAGTLWSGLHMVRTCRVVDPERRPLDVLQSVGSAFDVYVVVYAATDLAAGLYFYEPERHLLESRRAGDFREQLQELVIGQPSPQQASASVLFVVDFPRYQWRYRHPARRRPRARNGTGRE